jgi:hypothetical protein
MFRNKKKTNWGQVIGALAALKLMPFKKTLLGIAALSAGTAGAVYAVRRMRGASAET